MTVIASKSSERWQPWFGWIKKDVWNASNRVAADPEWKPSGKGRNAAKWSEVQALMQKRPTMSADQIAKLADCGVATVYRFKKETKVA